MNPTKPAKTDSKPTAALPPADNQPAEQAALPPATTDARTRALARAQAALEEARQEKRDLQEKISQMEISLAQAERYRERALVVAQELDLQRSRRILQILERLFDRSDVFDQIAPPFQRIKDDTVIFNDNLKGYHLQSSLSLHRYQFRSYRLNLGERMLKTIILLPILDVPVSTGYVGLELIGSDQRIMAQPTRLAVELQGDLVRFDLGPGVLTKGETFELRVFGRGLDAPFRIYEWRKYTLLGLGPIRRKPFMGFEFSE